MRRRRRPSPCPASLTNNGREDLYVHTLRSIPYWLFKPRRASAFDYSAERHIRVHLLLLINIWSISR